MVEAPTDMGLNVMELCKMNDTEVEGTCGGSDNRWVNQIRLA